MKKFFLGLAAVLMLTACNENRQPEAMTSVDSASVVTDLMMSRRSIRAYKDSVISRDTLNEILKCGIHAPNGQNLQSYEIRVIDSPALIDSITQAVVKDMVSSASVPMCLPPHRAKLSWLTAIRNISLTREKYSAVQMVQ